MAPPLSQRQRRWLSSPGVSAFINACAIIFLCANLIQNHVLFHERAVDQHASAVVSDADMPLSESTSLRKQERGDDHGESLDAMSAIGMTIPRGKAVALPSIQTTKEEEDKIQRTLYGGKGDKPHLGGFTDFDPLGVSPSLWKHMVTHLGVKSVLDVGCGKGISTAWFVTHGLEFVQCVEGSHDAVLQSLVPNADERVVEHDFSRGPWWPDRTVDAVWAVEFTEHVGRNFQPNYLTAFRKAALVFVTHSNWGGWHHVEVHDDSWWRIRWEAAGFVYSEDLTKSARTIAIRDQNLKNLTLNMRNDHLYFVGQHIYLNMQVFINPMVASLPEHAHLFAEHGCYGGSLPNSKASIRMDCTSFKKDHHTPLPESFKALTLTADMDNKWYELVKHLQASGRKPNNR